METDKSTPGECKGSKSEPRGETVAKGPHLDTGANVVVTGSNREQLRKIFTVHIPGTQSKKAKNENKTK